MPNPELFHVFPPIILPNGEVCQRKTYDDPLTGQKTAIADTNHNGVLVKQLQEDTVKSTGDSRRIERIFTLDGVETTIHLSYSITNDLLCTIYYREEESQEKKAEITYIPQDSGPLQLCKTIYGENGEISTFGLSYYTGSGKTRDSIITPIPRNPQLYEF